MRSDRAEIAASPSVGPTGTGTLDAGLAGTASLDTGVGGTRFTATGQDRPEVDRGMIGLPPIPPVPGRPEGPAAPAPTPPAVSEVGLDARVHMRVLGAGPDTPLDDTRLAALVRQEAPFLGAGEVAAAVARARARIGGLGPLEPLLADPAVTDILVNGPGPVWVERSGEIERAGIHLDRSAIDLLIERVVAPLGLRADRHAPVVDARLPDGSRVHVVLPPLAVDGPVVTIRRFGATTLPLDAFCTPRVMALLRWIVDSRLNVVVSGASGAGKTTLLNAICRHLPPGERVVTIEDAAELRLPGEHVVRLEARPAMPDGLPAVPIRELVRASLRMRPDRIIVGEVRGGEALDMIQAMNTGHDGSMASCHANSPADALRRVETMALAGGAEVPLAAVREQVVAAIDVVVHVARGPGGRRQVVAVAEVSNDPSDPSRAHALAGSDDVLATPTRAPRWPCGAAPPPPSAHRSHAGRQPVHARQPVP